MSKQAKANRTFVETATNMFYLHNQNCTIADFCLWLVKMGILTETTLNDWLAIQIYKKELERTKTEKNAKGVKWVAISRTLDHVPIGRSKLYNLLKSKSVKVDKTNILKS